MAKAVKGEEKFTKSKARMVAQSLGIGIAIVLVLLFITFYFIIGVSSVDGNSMVPTLTDQETLVFFRMEKTYDKGEIVRVDLPNGDYYVKRVIATEGDTIDLRDGSVYLNGNLLQEGYIQGRTFPKGKIVSYPHTVSPGHIFVMGDNREHSVDSREIGEISTIMIGGKILGQDK